MKIEYYICEMNADYQEILLFMEKVNNEFTPCLKETINIPEYVKKITENAIIFLATDNSEIVGMVAIYLNLYPEYSFGTFMSVKKEYRKYEVGIQLEEMYINYFKDSGTKGIRSIVNSNNKPVLKLHKYFGFKVVNKFYDDNLAIDRYELRLDFN